MYCKENSLIICLETKQKKEYVVTLQSCFMNLNFSLNEQNNYTLQLYGLPISDYKLFVWEEEISLVVNNEKVEGNYFSLTEGENKVVVILKKEEETGSLLIKKELILNCEEDSEDFFEIIIYGKSYRKQITLCKEENYEYLLEDIPYGTYTIKELVDQKKYHVSYIVDGKQSEQGSFKIEKDNTNLIIQNRKIEEKHVLRISRWILKEGRLFKPTYPSTYEITLNDGYAIREYTLDCKNRYVLEVEGNYHNVYMVEEPYSSSLIYEVDGVKVEKVEVRMDEDHEVRIIQVETSSGKVVVSKWIEEEGSLYKPSMQDSFAIQIHGYSEEEYLLDSKNDFILRIEDIENGYYQIEEKNNPNEVYYEIDGKRNEEGYFKVEEGDAITVNIINKKRENVLILKKKIKDENGNLITPDCGFYTVVVEQENQSNAYVLSQSNKYTCAVSLKDGFCKVYEKDARNEVQYRLDGVDFEKEVYFNVENASYEIVIISSKKQINMIL